MPKFRSASCALDHHLEPLQDPASPGMLVISPAGQWVFAASRAADLTMQVTKGRGSARKCSTFPKLHENIDFCFSAILMAILLATTEYFCCSQITLFILTCFISVVVAYLFFPKSFQRFFCFPPTKSCRSRAVQRLCEGGRCVWAWQREEEQSRTEKEAQKAEMWAKLNLRRNAIFQWHQYYL